MNNENNSTTQQRPAAPVRKKPQTATRKFWVQDPETGEWDTEEQELIVTARPGSSEPPIGKQPLKPKVS